MAELLQYRASDEFLTEMRGKARKEGRGACATAGSRQTFTTHAAASDGLGEGRTESYKIGDEHDRSSQPQAPACRDASDGFVGARAGQRHRHHRAADLGRPRHRGSIPAAGRRRRRQGELCDGDQWTRDGLDRTPRSRQGNGAASRRVGCAPGWRLLSCVRCAADPGHSPLEQFPL